MSPVRRTADARLILLLIVYFCVSCAAPLKTKPTAFTDPNLLANKVELNGLVVGVELLDTPARSEEAFGTDLGVSGVLPVRVIARNGGTHEFEIDARQMFGILPNAQLVQAYNLDQATGEIRASSIGTTVATGAVVGALAGAAVGAGIGAGVGQAYGDAGTGAATGAAVGGTAGAAHGAAAGGSDWITIEFRRQLAATQFGDKVLFPGNLDQGFVFLRAGSYSKLRVLVRDITENKAHDLSLPLQ